MEVVVLLQIWDYVDQLMMNHQIKYMESHHTLHLKFFVEIKKNTKESDVYSIGMLMWEIFSGHPPFDDRAHDHHLILDICKGLRPPILPNMPKDYVEMMKKCWDDDPSKRLTIRELLIFTNNYLDYLYKIESSNDET